MVTSTTDAVAIIIVFAILIQFCVDRVKEIAGEKVMGYVKAPVWALAFGIVFALVFKIDLFQLMGYPADIPIVAKVFTGLILSSGSTGVHELIAKIRDSRTE
ncbi:MAG: hypothetical protein PHP50_05810 [Lachnospiraceae bacterium]|nr:hypothetical protein [Lachnospiraceae bacterium]